MFLPLLDGGRGADIADTLGGGRGADIADMLTSDTSALAVRRL